MSSSTEILTGLNSEQQKAVTHKNGPLLIIAGAGTGKTTVITRRIAWLIAQKLAKPGEILALTFTDKAAEEMETRVDQLVPYGYIDVSISTFHAFGDRVLRDHALDLGMRPDYRVLTLPEQLIFLREHLFELPLKHYKSLADPTKHLEALLKVISRAQDEDISPEEYLKWGKGKGKKIEDGEEIEKQVEVGKVYQKYQQLKAEKGFVDFADQVGLALRIFREHPSILKLFQQRYKYILVDEFQDTNYSQFELLKLMAAVPAGRQGKAANITVVGDDDQSIYKFRGAAISNILNFNRVYKKSRNIVLTQNFRSTQTILDAAYRLIKYNDPDRLEARLGIDKKLISAANLKDKKIEHHSFDRFSSEADWIARQIKEKFETGKFKYSDFAILTRSNAETEEFRKALNMLGIPHQFSGGAGLYQNPEIQLISSFLKVIGDLTDSAALYNLSNSELYHLNPLELQKLNAFADRRNLTLHHVFSHLDGGEKEFVILDDIAQDSRVKVKTIMQDINYYLEYAREKSTGEVLYHFLKRSGYLKELMERQDPKNEKKISNLAHFFGKIKELKQVMELDRVSEFIKYLSLLKEAGDNPEVAQIDLDADAVNILTVHKAKGLEFRVVFLASLAAEKFPVRDRKEPIELPLDLVNAVFPAGDFHLQEERRLFYVGMTRAKEELYLTSSADYGGKRLRKVSRFVLETLDLPRIDISTIQKKTPLQQIELFAPVDEKIIIPESIIRGGLIHLSYYQIEDYLTCPLKYKYVHVLKVPLLPNHAIIYGSVLHKAVQAYDLARLNKQKFSEKDLLAVLANNWTSEGFVSREHEELRLDSARAALKLFYRQQKLSKRKLKFVEESFSVPKEDVVLRGRFDRVDELDGKYYIVDFKSSEIKKQEEADKKAKESLQLAIYALVWKEKYGALPFRVELCFFENGLVGSVAKSGKELDKTWDKIKTVAQGIRSAKFPAAPSAYACSYCAFNEICPSSAA